MQYPEAKKPAGALTPAGLPERSSGGDEAPDSSDATSKHNDAQAKPPLGRPPGRNSLVGDFQVAMWMAISDDLGAQDTADLITLLMSDHSIVINDVEGVVVKFSTDLRTTSIKSRGGNLLKRCSNVSLTLEETHWLTTSAGHLRALADSYISEASTHAERQAWRYFASENLLAMGWADTIERVFLQLKAAVASNVPPNEEPLKRKALAMLARYRASKS